MLKLNETLKQSSTLETKVKQMREEAKQTFMAPLRDISCLLKYLTCKSPKDLPAGVNHRKRLLVRHTNSYRFNIDDYLIEII